MLAGSLITGGYETDRQVYGAYAETPTPTPSPVVSQTMAPADTPVPVPEASPIVSPAPPAPKKKAALSDYKGIAIGTTTDDVRKKLGSPEDKGDDQDFYVFSDHETGQFFYDAEHKVKAIAITYTGNLASALTPVQVFGHDVAPNPEGGIFNMVRYPEAGYWISYNRTAGENPIISIAIQKL
jgi:hypothetical protein